MLGLVKALEDKYSAAIKSIQNSTERICQEIQSTTTVCASAMQKSREAQDQFQTILQAELLEHEQEWKETKKFFQDTRQIFYKQLEDKMSVTEKLFQKIQTFLQESFFLGMSPATLLIITFILNCLLLLGFSGYAIVKFLEK